MDWAVRRRPQSTQFLQYHIFSNCFADVRVAILLLVARHPGNMIAKKSAGTHEGHPPYSAHVCRLFLVWCLGFGFRCLVFGIRFLPLFCLPGGGRASWRRGERSNSFSLVVCARHGRELPWEPCCEATLGAHERLRRHAVHATQAPA